LGASKASPHSPLVNSVAFRSQATSISASSSWRNQPYSVSLPSALPLEAEAAKVSGSAS
jgi:hypothetical protein